MTHRMFYVLLPLLCAAGDLLAAKAPAGLVDLTPEQQAAVRQLVADEVARQLAETRGTSVPAEAPASTAGSVAPGNAAPKANAAPEAVALRVASRADQPSEQSASGCVLGFQLPGCGRKVLETFSIVGRSRSAAVPGIDASGRDPEQDRLLDSLERSSDAAESLSVYTLRRADALRFVPADRGLAGVPMDGESKNAVVRAQSDLGLNEAGTLASIRFTRQTARLDDKDAIRARVDSWALTITTPVDDTDNDRAQFATLDGFSPGLRVELGYGWQIADFKAKTPEALREDLDALCEGVNLEAGCRYEDSWTRIEDAKAQVTTEQEQKVLAGYVKALHVFQRRQFKWLREYDVRLQAGRGSFDYFTPQLQAGSERHIGWGIGASATFVPPTRRYALTVGVDVQRHHEDADAAILCPPSNGIDSVQCVNGPFGPPTEVTSKLAWAQVRGAIGWAGYQLRATHDFESGDNGIDLPLYLVRNAAGKLSGGLRLGWTSEDDFNAGIFVSTPFEL